MESHHLSLAVAIGSTVTALFDSCLNARCGGRFREYSGVLLTCRSEQTGTNKLAHLGIPLNLLHPLGFSRFPGPVYWLYCCPTQLE